MFFALWYGSFFGIGSVPDLDIEVIDIHTRLAVVLRLHPEGVQAIAIDRSCDLDMDEAILNIRYPKGTLPVRGFICPKCGYEVISFEDAKAASETAERLGLLEPEGTITRKIYSAPAQTALFFVGRTEPISRTNGGISLRSHCGFRDLKSSSCGGVKYNKEWGSVGSIYSKGHRKGI